jgi:hypothetical protein
MMRPIAFILSLLLVNSSLSHAQHSAVLTVGIHRGGLPDLARIPVSNAIQIESKHPAAWPFVALGAVVGGTAATLSLMHAMKKKSNGGFVDPAIVIAVPVGGLVLGGFAGWVAYEIAYWPRSAT